MTASTSHSFLSSLADIKELVAPRLSQVVATASQHPRLQQALVHSIQGSSKFIRPFLVLAFARCAHKPWTAEVIDTAVAVELVHSYSLVHDDLPAMDNADLRRGLPSCWRAFDEATAILAGDALIPLSYDLIINLPLAIEIRLDLLKEFSHAIGGHGLVAGQMMDLYPNNDLQSIREMQLLKTGALLKFSCQAGILVAGSPDPILLDKAGQFGLNLGLIYQITDDFLSEQSTVEMTGKPVHNDADKLTFLTVLGTGGARSYLQQLLEDTHALAHDFENNDCLHQLLDFLAVRTF